MNAAGENSSAEPAWPRRRWLAVFAVFAGLQLGSSRDSSVGPWLPDPPTDASEARLEISSFSDPRTALVSGIHVSSPPRTLRGFSGAAARSFPPPEYTLSEWPGRPVGCPRKGQPDRAGALRPALVPRRCSRSTPSGGNPGERMAPLLLSTNTLVEARGALAGRAIRGRTPPPVLPGTDVLSPTVVEVAAAPSGMWSSPG